MRTIRWRLPFALLFAPLLPGCIIGPADMLEAPLEDIGGPGLEVRLFSVPRGGSLRLTYESLKEQGVCLRFTGKARLNGVELEQRTAGSGFFFVTPIGGGVDCTEPEWLFPTPPWTEAVSAFEITDGTGQLLYGISSLVVKRSVSIRRGQPPIVPGGPLTLAWSPETDQLTGVGVRMGFETLSLPEVAMRNGRIGFLVPPGVQAGAQEVTLNMSIQPGTAHCEPDPDRCKAWIPSELASDTTFVPVNVR